MLKKTRIFFCIIAIITSLSSVAQINFFTQDTDTSTNTLYARNLSSTILLNVSYPAYTFGVSYFFHNNLDYISYYVHVATNGIQSKTIQGFEKNNTSSMQIDVPFTLNEAHIGIGHALNRNLLVYIHTGIAYYYSSFANKNYPDFVFSDIPAGMSALLGAGILFTTDSNITFQAGMQSFSRSLRVGVGYSFNQ